MSGRETCPERRGGGDRARTDAFRYAPGRSGLFAFISIGALGAIAIAVVLLDLGGVQAKAGAAWVVPAGAVLIATMIGLLWLTRRAPVLLTVGPEGLNLPAALARPVAWAEYLAHPPAGANRLPPAALFHAQGRADLGRPPPLPAAPLDHASDRCLAGPQTRPAHSRP